MMASGRVPKTIMMLKDIDPSWECGKALAQGQQCFAAY
ncbi:hypothetical protein EMIT0P44_20193 [Pseudomonas sp. IT-P44]